MNQRSPISSKKHLEGDHALPHAGHEPLHGEEVVHAMVVKGGVGPLQLVKVLMAAQILHGQ
jgi:hypothetical protein